jgi:hypothetical protein
MGPPGDLFQLFIRPLNRLKLAYMVTGSAASMAYGEPRLTLDMDLVVELPRERIPDLLKAFPPDAFYCPPAEVIVLETDREMRGHFNVIHMETGFKADFYPVGRDAFQMWGMAHRRTVDLGGETVMLAPPEYVIVRKLEYYREGGSEKHMRDISGMLLVRGQAIEEGVIQEWAVRLGLEAQWEEAKRISGQKRLPS